jgi:hypothetical protein
MDATEKKTARFLLKLSPSEKAELERQSAAAGTTVSEYLRSVLKSKDAEHPTQQAAHPR